MLRVLHVGRRIVIMLMAVVFTAAAAFHSTTPDARASIPSLPTCTCCNFNPANCDTPSCCITPENGRHAPAAPAPAPSSARAEWQGLAATPSALLALPRFALHD